MKRRVLVLGASGFIGRRIVAALAKSDWAAPLAASRRAASGSRDSVERIQLDATVSTEVSKAIADVDAIVNCVAGDAHTIVESARVVFEEAARRPTPPRIVHLSSLAAYGSASGTVDETAPLLGDLDAYSAAKVSAEQLASAYPHHVILRPGIVYGPESPWWSDRIARLLVAGRLGDLGNLGRGCCNLVYVEDVAAAVLQALTLEDVEGQAFNLSIAPQPTWNEYFALYAAALKLPPVKKISATRITAELKVFAPPLKIFEMLGEKLKRRPQPPLRPWLIKLCGHEIKMSTAKAADILRLQQTSVTAGLQTTAQWFLAGGRTPL